MNKNKISLQQLIFMALCCDIGMFSKKLIAPATNMITDALHIPGGIGTSFSIMFVVMGASICNITGCAIIMCIVQSALAVFLGSVGSMGILTPIGYIVPGIIIEISLFLLKRFRLISNNAIAITNALAGASAALCANVIVFGLKGLVLMLYVSVSFTSGLLFGYLGAAMLNRLKPVLHIDKIYD